MIGSDEFLAVLSSGNGPLCDDCLYLVAGWNRRQRANLVGRHLGATGAIERTKGSCSACGKTKTVSQLTGTGKHAVVPIAAQPSPVGAAAPASYAWFWEGNVQAAIVTHLAAAGYRVKQVVDTASKAQGVDILAQRGGQVWVTVKGYPRPGVR